MQASCLERPINGFRQEINTLHLLVWDDAPAGISNAIPQARALSTIHKLYWSCARTDTPPYDDNPNKDGFVSWVCVIQENLKVG